MTDHIPANLPRVRPVPPVPIRGPDRSVPPPPMPLTSFVGRVHESTAVVDLLREPDIRLVTLTGAGGVGKTRLALRVAEEAGGDFHDGVAFVPLAEVGDATLVAPAVAHVLGIREAGDRPLADRLADALRERHLLLVLDNVEHLAAAAPLVVALLTACPRLAVLTTGRAPLSISGEHVVAVPPLGLPRSGDGDAPETIVTSDAVRLFVARARAARHDFALTDANSPAVAAIVRRLDGLPLAIELAAARIAHLSPAALIARLERLLPLLTGGHRDLPERQRTMAATIDWSHDLLAPGEQLLFRRLAVFVGGFTLEAAEAVSRGVEESRSREDRPLLDSSTSRLLDSVGSLVAKSLLRQDDGPDGEPRFAMLETVREYGLDRLAASGEEQQVRTSHAYWYVALAERADPAIWGGPDHGSWLDRLEADLANLRAALAWLEGNGDGPAFLRLAAALGGLWHFRSHRAEGHAWLTRALAMGGTTVPAARAMALIKRCMLDQATGGANAVSLVEEAVALRRELGDARGVGHALIMLGALYKNKADFDRASQAWAEAVALLEPLDDISGLALIRLQLGLATREQGDAERADALLLEALELYRRAEFQYGIAQTLLVLGRVDADRGNVAGAAARYAESLPLWGEIGSQEGLADVIAATGCLAAASGHPDVALLLLGAAAVLGDALGHVPPEPERTRRAQATSTARAALGEAEFAQAWACGRALSPEGATAQAAALLAAFAGDGGETHVPSLTELTAREQEVLALIADGLSDRQVAAALFVGPGTVRSHLTSIFGKLEVGSRTAAVATARRQGIL